MTNLSKNIQRIAKTDELKKLIEDLLNESDHTEKSSIDGNTYTAFVGAFGGVSGVGGGTVPAVGTATDQAQSTDDAFDVNGSDVFSDQFGDLFENDYGDVDLDDLATGDFKIGDRITGLDNLQDCSDSSKVAGIVLGNHRPPTDGLWEDQNADYHPDEDKWRQGYWYQATGATTIHKGATAYDVMQQVVDDYNENGSSTPYALESIDDYDPDTLSSGSSFFARVTRTVVVGVPYFDVNVIINKTGCSVGVDAWCPTTAPTPEWIGDGIHQLKFDGAQFVTSDFENLADIVPQWNNNPSKISGCTSSGIQVSLEGSKSGDLLVNIESGTNSGDTIVVDRQTNIIVDVIQDTEFLKAN